MRRLAACCGLVVQGAVLVAAGHGPLAGPDVTDPPSWSRWLAATDPVDAGLAVVRLGLLAVTAYLLVLTVLAAVADTAGSLRLAAAVEAVTVPAVRPLLAAVLGLGVAASATAVAAPGGAPVRVALAAATAPVPAGPPSAPGTPATATMRLLDAGGADAAAPPAPPAPAAPVNAPGGSWTVAPGDHFWSVAGRVLTGALGHQPDLATHAAYWERLVAANRGVLADPANPDLLFPGQVLALPQP